MPAKKKTKVSRAIASKARQLLEFAEQRALEVADWVELHNAVFGIGGKANELFPTESERTAFCRTKERKQISALFDRLPSPPIKDLNTIRATTDGAIQLHLPRSVHAALLAEAQVEGVSLNQLCLSKLLAQLRAVV